MAEKGIADMEPSSTIGTVARLLASIGRTPLWVMVGAALSLTVFIALPRFRNLVAPDVGTLLFFAAITFWIFVAARGIAMMTQAVKSARTAREAARAFHVTPVNGQCHWGVSEQPDGSFITQVSGHFMVRNRTAAPLHVMSARVLKPKIKGEELPGLVATRGIDRNEYGTPSVAGNFIPPGQSLPVVATILIRGTPRQRNGIMHAVVELSDADGNRERTKVELRPIAGTDRR